MKPFLVSFFLALAVGTSIIGWLYFRERFFPSDANHTPQTEKRSYAETKEIEQENREQDAISYNQAIATKNKTLCAGIVNLQKKQECEDMLLAIAAMEKKDISFCDTIKTQEILIQCKDRLSLQNAEEKQSKMLCNAISNSGSRSYCYESIDEARLRLILRDGTATDDVCESLEEKFQDACTRSIVREKTETLYIQAVQGSSRESCELIPLEEERNLCLDTVNLREALTVGDVSLCDAITHTEKQGYCKSTLAKKDDAINFKQYVANNNLEGCATLTDNTLRNRCNDSVILNLVRMNKDRSLCESLTNTGVIATCHKLSE